MVVLVGSFDGGGIGGCGVGGCGGGDGALLSLLLMLLLLSSYRNPLFLPDCAASSQERCWLFDSF